MPAAKLTPAQIAETVVEVVVDALELQQQRARAGQLAIGGETKCLLAGLRVGDAIADGARGAGALRVRQRCCERVPGGGGFEAAALVEEAHVEVQDAFADDVEAKVPGLDDACVHRADRDLVGVMADGGHGPGGEWCVVVEQRPHRLVADEADVMEVVGFALSPAAAGITSTMVSTPRLSGSQPIKRFSAGELNSARSPPSRRRRLWRTGLEPFAVSCAARQAVRHPVAATGVITQRLGVSGAHVTPRINVRMTLQPGSR